MRTDQNTPILNTKSVTNEKMENQAKEEWDNMIRPIKYASLPKQDLNDYIKENFPEFYNTGKLDPLEYIAINIMTWQKQKIEELTVKLLDEE